MATREKIREQLIEFSKLDDNWSSYKSAPPSAQAIELARSFLSAIPEPKIKSFDLAPLLDGGVNVGYDDGDRWFSFDAFNDGKMNVEASDDLDIENVGMEQAICIFQTLTRGTR